MKLVFSEKEKPVVEKLANIVGFPIEKFISSDGYTIYLKQSVVIAKLEGYIQQVKNMPESWRKKITNNVLSKLSEEFPGGFIRK